MELKNILTKKAVVVGVSALATAATTGLVYFLGKNARMDVVEEVMSEEVETEDNIINVDFKEETEEVEQENEEVEQEDEEENK